LRYLNYFECLPISYSSKPESFLDKEMSHTMALGLDFDTLLEVTEQNSDREKKHSDRTGKSIQALIVRKTAHARVAIKAAIGLLWCCVTVP
jgi:hypothetical protein